MATATIVTDLTEVSDCDSTTAGGVWTGSSVSSASTDPDPLEGTAWVGGILKKNGDSMTFTPTASIDMSGGNHYRMPIITILKPNLLTVASGGITLTFTGSTSGTAVFNISGTDVYIGGWEVLVINPYATPDSGTAVVGNVTSMTLTVGIGTSAKNVITIQTDWNSYGTGFYVYGGTSGDEIGFAEIDTTDVYYLLTALKAGVYRLTGKFQIGDSTGTNTTYFKDAGKVMFFDNLTVDSDLYELIIAGNATGVTYVDLSGNFITADTQPYNVDFSDTNIDEVLLNGTTIQNARTGVLLGSTTEGSGAVFDACAGVDPNGATLSTSAIKNTTEDTTGSLVINLEAEAELCTDMTFSGYAGNTRYAIYVDAGVTQFDMDNWQFDSTASYALYWAGTVGTLTVYSLNGTNIVVGGCDSAGGTVAVVQSPVTTAINVKSLSLGTNIVGAQTLVYVTSAVGGFPYLDSVNITGSGTTATVAHTDHGLATGDNVVIRGANEDEYNGAYEIIVTGVSAYTYTMSESASATPATGTITSTFAFINDVTDANGDVDDTRVVSVSQPIAGWVRKSTTSPFYQQGNISGTVDSASGLSINVQLADDE